MRTAVHPQGRRRPTEEPYTAVEAARLAGISYRQLDYWDRTGFLRPSLATATGSGTYRRYSQADVDQLELVAALLKLGVSLRFIRDSGGPERARDFLVERLLALVERVA